MRERETGSQSSEQAESRLEMQIDAVLTALGTAEPDAALQGRVLQRLAATPARPLHFLRGMSGLPQRYVAAAGAIAAVCLVAVVLEHGRLGTSHGVPLHHGARVEPAIAPPRAANTPEAYRLQPRGTSGARHAGVALQSDPAPAPLEAASPDGGDMVAARTLTAHCAVAACERTQTVLGAAALRTASAHAAQDPSFPAPEMPMTEQERLLLQIAHRNDPVQVAMLDPVARTARDARERAEAAQFFAPPALPASLQQEIDSALRSQYVNTPPPRELLAQTTDRSYE